MIKHGPNAPTPCQVKNCERCAATVRLIANRAAVRAEYLKGIEFPAVKFCPCCGSKMPKGHVTWKAADGCEIYRECPKCHAHFGVAGAF